MSRRRNAMRSFKGEDGILNFDSTLVTLEVIKNHAHITKNDKEFALQNIKVAMRLLSISIKYETLKEDCAAKSINIAEHSPMLDKRIDGDSLKTFFGTCSLSEMRKLLKVITRKIIEVSKAIE